MKINSKVLSIPPYISTSWENVAALQVEPLTSALQITLKNKATISIPGLHGTVLEEIFQAHAEFLEQATRPLPFSALPTFPTLPTLPPNTLSIGIAGDGEGNFSGMMQHDPNQSETPPLPKEILQKIAQVAKALGLDDDAFTGGSEPHCNCPYCQIAKAIYHPPEEPAPDIDNTLPSSDEVNEKELTFREWDVEEVSNKLYRVSDPCNQQEQYQVFLGQPMGCTCGKNNCEHILAVLRS
ncbi:MAG: SWIM zinc finger family protein [Verrucomicrobia bacterium]|nr:SWIM zinc finger family protein [Verrucomicrobiota bacterium]